MVATKGYGLTVEDIDMSSPEDMKPYLKAHKEELKERDCFAWLSNQYTLSAVSVAIEHCFAGKKAKSEYIEKPIFKEIEEQNKPFTEDDLQKQRELFVAKLQLMKANFDLNKENEVKINHKEE